YVGYKSDTITIAPNKDYYEIQLASNVDLSEVTVTERSKATLKPRTTVLQTEKITYDELCRAACCNLSESFSTNASVDVSYSDAATGAKQIKMLGLSGAYVQMLTENAPNFRGAASLYGLDYVPAPWMESIQVSKGTSSVKNGYEAITGQINVEYKKPQTADPLTVNLFGSDAGRMEGNVDGNVMLNEYLGTGLFVHYSNDKFAHDANKDGFLDQPKLEQLNLFNRWYYKKDNFISQLGIKFINETRENGQIKHGDNEMPDMPLYKIGIDTKRGEIFTKNGYIIDKEKNMSVALIASGSIHSQKSHYGAKDLQATPWDYNTYNLRQDNAYANLMYETEFTRKHKISTGVSFNYDGLRQESDLPYFESQKNNIAFAKYRNEYVTGAYAEYTYNLNDKFVVLAGIRGDYHNQYGFFATPRLHLKWNILEQLHLRASAGKGYRSVNVLAENNYLFASN
ncbi:MAG: TonB-dependent receptor plug domain-containing protein, partial [Bacteroidales bacterium]